MSFCVVFSIVLLDVNRVNAASFVAEKTSNFKHMFPTTWCADSLETNSDTFTYEENFYFGDKFVSERDKVYQFTFLISDKSTVSTNNNDGSNNSTRLFYVIIMGQKYYLSKYQSIIINGLSLDSVIFGVECHQSVGGKMVSGGSPTSSFISTYLNADVKLQAYVFSPDELSSLPNNAPIVNGLDKNNQSIEKGNKLQEEANETSKGILGKITDFFGSFFENIINSFKSLFIPDDGYFSDFFNRLNQLFSDKLGILYAPVDLFIKFLQGIQNAEVGSSVGLTFPGMKWEDTVIIEKTVVNFDLINEKFPELQEKIYFVTDVMMIGAVIVLFEKKVEEVVNK